MTTIVKENHNIANDEDLKDDLEHLKEDMATLRKDLHSVFESLKGLAASKAGDSVAKGKELANDAGEHIPGGHMAQPHQRRNPPHG